MLTVSGCTLSGNSAANGGGIANDGMLTVTGSIVSGNSGYLGGGGIANFGTATVSNSTLLGNSATFAEGGGINNFGTATVSNNTLYLRLVGGEQTPDWDGRGHFFAAVEAMRRILVNGDRKRPADETF
jgi:hypothetical protein